MGAINAVDWPADVEAALDVVDAANAAQRAAYWAWQAAPAGDGAPFLAYQLACCAQDAAQKEATSVYLAFVTRKRAAERGEG